MNSIEKNRTLILFSLLCTLALGYGFFEWINYQNTPSKEDQLTLARESVELSSNKFSQFVFDFTNQTSLFTGFIKSEIENGTNPVNIYKTMNEDYTFWGEVIYKEGEPWLWDGFIPTEYPENLLDIDESLYVSVGTDNNVIFLFSLVPIFIEEEDGSVVRYDVYTRTKIEQENILNIGKDLETAATNFFSYPTSYPVTFDFNKLSYSDELASAILSTASSDSLGKVSALDTSFDEYKKTYKARVEIWRAFFIFSFLILIGVLVFYFSQSLGGWRGLFIKLFAFTTVWLLVKTIYPLIDIESRNLDYLSNIFLVDYIVNAIFYLLISITISSFLIKLKRIEPYKKPLGMALLSIFISSVLGSSFLSFLFTTSQAVTNSTVSVMDLELVPSILTLIFYISATISFTSLFVLFITICWFLFRNFSESFWILITGLVTGFGFLLIVSKFAFADGNHLNWVLPISILFFLITLIFSIYLVKRAPAFLYSSKLRLLIFMSYLAACFMYIAFANGNTTRQNQRMLEVASAFSVDEEVEIRDITIELLSVLTFELSKYSVNAFDEPFFHQLVQDVIKPDWLEYTISVQVINGEGSRFADYTISLSPPQWSTAFRIEELEFPFEDEQIQRNNLRPILRNKPINTINASYSSFLRGWIPLFENPTSNERVGWILCSVYRELPQLDRPLRTVISAKELPYVGETLVSTEYENGISTRSSIHGAPLEIYTPAKLPDRIIDKTNTDSIFTTSALVSGEEIKELYIKKNASNIVRVATKKVGFKQHIFSFLRFFFVQILAGIAFMVLFSWKEHWRILGSERKFKDRLIDRFILASLICLITLVGASYFVLNSQNNSDVQERLFSRLENLTTSLESELNSDIEDPAELQKITSILDIDAALYKNGTLANSTTSQIFAQHILPKTVPWDIFTKISANESDEELKTILLDGQKMLIGYKPWLDENNNVLGIAAIPTFQKAPKFNDRLLSTTSYLIAFFTLIFGFLMLGVGVISSQLTSPLEAISEGLKRISDGDLEATLPVRGKDEIGTLTKAYNVMAKRLKTVQKELAEAEREAAWKEMAQQVAHEIKNPLTPMKLNLQHLERQMQGTRIELDDVKPQVSKITSSMIEQIDSLNKIASDFSKFAKPIEQEFIPVELNKIARSVAEMYEPDYSFNLVTDISKKPLPVLGVNEELRRVLVNLIKNSKEALNEDGTITIHTFASTDKTSAFISIIDNGQGIKKEDQDKIFVPNFSTKSSGTGLGLAITKKIIEEHNGEISFVSSEGEGSSFTIRLPLLKKSAR